MVTSLNPSNWSIWGTETQKLSNFPKVTGGKMSFPYFSPSYLLQVPTYSPCTHFNSTSVPLKKTPRTGCNAFLWGLSDKRAKDLCPPLFETLKPLWLHHIFGSSIINGDLLSSLSFYKATVVWILFVCFPLCCCKGHLFPLRFWVHLSTGIGLHILTCFSQVNFLRKTAAQSGHGLLLQVGYRPDFGSDARVARLLWNSASQAVLGDWRQIPW